MPDEFFPVTTRAERKAVRAHPALFPEQLLKLARQYLLQSKYRPEEPIIYWPAYQSIGHTTELLLKAYLARKGKTEAEVSRYRHDIRGLLADAEAAGLAVTDRQRWLLEALDDIHAELWARYVKKHAAPVTLIFQFDPVVEALFSAVCEEFGVPGESLGWPPS